MTKNNLDVASNDELEILVSSTLKHMKNLGYRPQSLCYYKKMWRTFLDFSKTEDQNRFTVELAQKFLIKQGVPVDNPEIQLHRKGRLFRAAMRILTEFYLHGCFHKRQQYTAKVKLSAQMEGILNKYIEFCRDPLRISPRTLRGRKRKIIMFLHFLKSRNLILIANIQPAVLSEFIISQSHYSHRTLRDITVNLRLFLRYLWMQGYISSDLSYHVPKIRVRQDARIPSVWRKEDVDALLAAVDRSSSIGKRNYAILLLAARLGMRVGDIRELRIENLHWDESRIDITQAKTGTPLCLPLTEEIGSAIIEYLRCGRPPVSHRVVFLRHRAPFEPFGFDNNLHYLITTYRQRAGIKLPDQCRRGMNALRHSLASRLLEVGAPLQDISNVMGHLSPETTRLYTKIDIETLRRVALDPEEVHHV